MTYLRRRDFLKFLGATTVLVGTPAAVAGCSDDAVPGRPGSTPEESDKVFPQGLASGDPREDRVVLWTRVEAAAAGKTEGDIVEIEYVIATDEALSAVVARGTLQASPNDDHAVKLLAKGLSPATRYYYRFSAGGTTTRVARTKTAPLADTDTPVKYAFASCQDFIGRQYHAWRALVEEKVDLDFVLFLGDYIYETVNDARFQVTDPSRTVSLPNGIDISRAQDKSRTAASTLADYRALYKAYRSDPALKEAHRLYPFVTIWDDHEFANDCWQDHATDFNELDPRTDAETDEKDTPRRTNANRAWAEYQPVDLDASKPESLKIYRTLRFGKHVELFLTDQRLYRSDHVIAEGPLNLYTAKSTLNTELGSRLFVLKKGFDPEEAAKKPTMLGEPQKKWFTDAVKASNATWKVWGNEVQLWQQVIDLSSYKSLPGTYQDRFYFSCDQWDGYRTERAEILTTLKDISNLVVNTGDIHAFYAAELQIDFDVPASAVAVEYVTAGISSGSLYSITEQTISGSPTLTGFGLLALVPELDKVLASTNPHLKYADSNSNGVAIAQVSAEAFDVTFLKVGSVLEKNYGGVVDRKNFRTRAGVRAIELVS